MMQECAPWARQQMGSNCCGAASAITVAEGNNIPKTHSNKSAAIRRITVSVQQRQPWCWTGPRRILECLALYQGTTLVGPYKAQQMRALAPEALPKKH